MLQTQWLAMLPHLPPIDKKIAALDLYLFSTNPDDTFEDEFVFKVNDL
jgi:hypothetical protein